MAVETISHHLEKKDKSVAMFVYDHDKGKAMQKTHVLTEEIKVYRPVIDVTPEPAKPGIDMGESAQAQDVVVDPVDNKMSYRC